MATAALFTLHLCRFGRNLFSASFSPTRLNSSHVTFRRNFRRRPYYFSGSAFSRRFSTVAASGEVNCENGIADEKYDVVVVGGGHAGCEAALASARFGARTLLLTLNIDRIAWQPCNPAVGGPAKSQLVHEVDALGGVIGKIADRSVYSMSQEALQFVHYELRLIKENMPCK